MPFLQMANRKSCANLDSGKDPFELNTNLSSRTLQRGKFQQPKNSHNRLTKANKIGECHGAVSIIPVFRKAGDSRVQGRGLSFKEYKSWVCWHIPVMPALGGRGLRQKDCSKIALTT